ncbi:uncharacterized protein LOC131642529 [Vicia villosa]|uniref:uncharacterized protein LOC131642529 n=1 Tax=Vicia villosa TaxID=3911 RepID=UPI00273B435B|nr:uncharacterized protein LOC131642529 [Vicia villosa]
MITSWNVRGLNKAGKFREISSRLHNLNPAIMILIETRVKEKNADMIRNKMKLKGSYLDNYDKHANGRIWICWDDNRRHIELIDSTDQFIHCKIRDDKGDFKYWMNVVYAHNQLQLRKKLWQDILKIHSNQQGLWMVIGDFNNVAKVDDRIGGSMVTEKEYVDLIDMMNQTGLYEKESQGDYFTWTNKQKANAIYSRIDCLLGNTEWMQQNEDAELIVMSPSVSDHSMLALSTPDPIPQKRSKFKFLNYTSDLNDFTETVKLNWNLPLNGRPMYVVWKKLQRLQPDLKKLTKPRSDITREIAQARVDLATAQDELLTDKMNGEKIVKVQTCTAALIQWQELKVV